MGELNVCSKVDEVVDIPAKVEPGKEIAVAEAVVLPGWEQGNRATNLDGKGSME